MTRPAHDERVAEREVTFKPLSAFLAEQNAKGIAEHGVVRWKWWRLKAKLRIKWHYYWNGKTKVSQRAFDLTANSPTQSSKDVG